MVVNFILAIEPCQHPDVLKTINFIKNIMEVIFIIVPIMLILFITIDLIKKLTSNNMEDLNKTLNLTIKRIICAVAVFFVPIIVSLFNNLLGDLGVNYAQCLQNANKRDIEKYEALYNVEQEKILEEQKKKKEEAEQKKY